MNKLRLLQHLRPATGARFWLDRDLKTGSAIQQLWKLVSTLSKHISCNFTLKMCCSGGEEKNIKFCYCKEMLCQLCILFWHYTTAVTACICCYLGAICQLFLWDRNEMSNRESSYLWNLPWKRTAISTYVILPLHSPPLLHLTVVNRSKGSRFGASQLQLKWQSLAYCPHTRPGACAGLCLALLCACPASGRWGWASACAVTHTDTAQGHVSLPLLQHSKWSAGARS